MGIVDVCPMDGGSQWTWLEMGECYSKTSVVPGSEVLETGSMISGSSLSDRQPKRLMKQSLKTEQMTFTLAQLATLELCLKEAEEKSKSLSEQLAVSEETKSNLLKQVSWLEDKLTALDHIEANWEQYEKMVLLKEQCIENLRAELKATQEQFIAYKLKHKKKMKRLKTDLATAKQEAAFTILELNEKIKMLCEGKPAPREDDSPEEFCGGLPPVEEVVDRKISLIMELSTQLSFQTEKITELEEELEEKEKMIQQLEDKWEPHFSQKEEDSTECLEETPIYFNNSIPPVVSDKEL
ncbi:coiled-coil domain-containing protein 192 [Sciurus carolinensis]|uniref:coiled-coil domain-containing protein 192 n=1 Tax=Sciurus carolinensis TaxID=30640 RepID=UPI001FB3A9B2|nr:coiled-coil domain-containing protein 192 [Sciurus carolinensis]